MPGFEDMVKQGKNLPAAYMARREKMDDDRWFAFFRSATNTADRQNFAAFVSNVATQIGECSNYLGLDNIYRNTHPEDISVQLSWAERTKGATCRAFLERAIAGAFLLARQDVIDAYEGDVKTATANSALVQVINETVGGLTLAEQHTSVATLQRVMRVISYAKEGVTWHPTIKPAEIEAMLAKLDKSLQDKIAEVTLVVPDEEYQHASKSY